LKAGSDKATQSAFFSQESVEFFEPVRVDQVNARSLEDIPHLLGVRRGPEAEATVFGMGFLDEAVEFGAFGFGEGSGAGPLEMLLPIVADERHEVRRKVFAEVAEASVETGEALLLCEHPFARAVAGDNNSDGIGLEVVMVERGEDGRIFLEKGFKRGVGLVRIGFDIDQECDVRAIGINASSVFLGTFFERGEIEVFESAIGLEIASFMADEKFAVGKVDVSFNAAEVVVQSVEERAGVFVIIVSVGLQKRRGRVRRKQCCARKGQQKCR
jgi:hypothetical protein